MSKKKHIRPISLCVCSKNNKILVFYEKDPISNSPFYRPVGGGIEFGEFADDAVKREFLEELNAHVYNLELICIIENIFEYKGEKSHEIVYIFDGTLEEISLYNKQLKIIEDDVNHTSYPACWKSLGEIESENIPLYPVELSRQLRKRGFR